MDARQLDRLFWRVRYETYGPERFEGDLRNTLAELADEALPLLERASTIRLWNDSLLGAYADALSRARRTTDLRQFPEAVRHLQQARRLLAAMAQLLAAADELERVSAAVEALDTLASTARLRRLPAVASLAQIVDAAKLAILDMRFFQAAHIGAVCGRMAAPLLERRPVDAAARRALGERIEAIAALSVTTRPFAPPDDEDSVEDGSVAVLKSLLRGDRSALAARLVAELEIDLAGRRRFLLQYERQRLGNDDDVRAVVRERRWDGAVDYYWHQSIATHGGAVERQRARAAAAAAELDAAIASTVDAIERGE